MHFSGALCQPAAKATKDEEGKREGESEGGRRRKRAFRVVDQSSSKHAHYSATFKVNLHAGVGGRGRRKRAPSCLKCAQMSFPPGRLVRCCGTIRARSLTTTQVQS